MDPYQDTVASYLLTILVIRLGPLSPDAAEILNALTVRGVFFSADGFARSLGMRDRHQLAHALQRSGLRGLRTIAGWIKVRLWLMEAECGAVSLCHAALEGAEYPGSRYRLVKQVTGLVWSELRSRGLGWAVEELVRECVLPGGTPGVRRALPSDAGRSFNPLPIAPPPCGASRPSGAAHVQLGVLPRRPDNVVGDPDTMRSL
jgi:hypothetical protein